MTKKNNVKWLLIIISEMMVLVLSPQSQGDRQSYCSSPLALQAL